MHAWSYNYAIGTIHDGYTVSFYLCFYDHAMQLPKYRAANLRHFSASYIAIYRLDVILSLLLLEKCMRLHLGYYILPCIL